MPPRLLCEQMVDLVCPTDRTPLSSADGALVCDMGHRHLLDESSNVPTLFDPSYGLPFHADSWDPLGREPGDYPALGPGDVDDFVQSQIPGSGGYLYLNTRLRSYPRPTFPLGRSEGRVLDVGAGWGRWSFSAAAAGWSVVAVDPWIDNCRAMRRVASQLGFLDQIETLNADGRRLPLPDGSVDAAFSYSVLQHLPKSEAETALNEMARVVAPGGRVRVQLPNIGGIRQRLLYRRGVVADEAFLVRPWTFAEVEDLGRSLSDSWAVSVDGFFSLNAQWSERSAMRLRAQAIVAASEMLRLCSARVPQIRRWADSLWLEFVVR